MSRWVPIDKGLLRELPKDRPYTRLEAMFSLACDYDDGKTATVQGYASLWRWSCGKVRRFLDDVGAVLEYPENTSRRQNQRGQIMIQIADRSRTENGQIKIIDSKWLASEADRKRTDDGQKTDRSCSATKNPNPKPKFSPPTLDEVRAYCLERGNGIDPEAWHNHYGAKGWMIGKAPMKDWKAAVRTWEKSAATPQPASAQSGGHPSWY
ncbi:hypothetical protein ANRL4_03225 [Anaerolineae bacterium]|nr:hypothetical protein ANRL4_03225 [Anaerolineae bacterium]